MVSFSRSGFGVLTTKRSTRSLTGVMVLISSLRRVTSVGRSPFRASDLKRAGLRMGIVSFLLAPAP